MTTLNSIQEDFSDSKSWLSPEFAVRLAKIRELVKQLHINVSNIPQCKFFTPHGVSHCKAVEKIVYLLIPPETHLKLTDIERFFLLSSVWLHDIGMLRGIFPDDDQISDQEIRESHHVRSADFIRKHYSRVGILFSEKEAIALLVKCHRRRFPLSEVKNSITIDGHGIIHLRLLGAFLRLADALHIDETRSPEDQYAISLTYDIPVKSKIHWLRSKFVLGVTIDIANKEIRIYFKEPYTTSSMPRLTHKNIDNTLEKIYDVIIQDLQDELDTVVETLCSDEASYFFKITKHKQKIEFEPRFLKEVMVVLNYFSLMDNPSSSSLLAIVIESIYGILDSLSSSASKTNDHYKEMCRKSVLSFLEEIEVEVLASRRSHTSLRRNIDEIRKKLRILISTNLGLG